MTSTGFFAVWKRRVGGNWVYVGEFDKNCAMQVAQQHVIAAQRLSLVIIETDVRSDDGISIAEYTASSQIIAFAYRVNGGANEETTRATPV